MTPLINIGAAATIATMHAPARFSQNSRCNKTFNQAPR
jgi:hypothetical protein